MRLGGGSAYLWRIICMRFPMTIRLPLPVLDANATAGGGLGKLPDWDRAAAAYWTWTSRLYGPATPGL